MCDSFLKFFNCNVIIKKAKLILLVAIILSLNLIWEFSHFRLYIDLTGIPVNLHLIMAGFVDLFLVSFIFGINSFFRRGIDWIKETELGDYFFVVIFGALIAIIIEFYSISQGRWVYTASMPTIFGIEISPLVQLFTTGILGIWFFKLFK